MSSLKGARWPWAVLAGVVIFAVGIDVGVRLGSRGAAPPAPAVVDNGAGRRAATPPPASTTREPALPKVERPPPLEGSTADEARAAEEALEKGDKAAAAKHLAAAEAAAENVMQKEGFRWRRIRVLRELGKLDEVRKIAEAIKAQPARGEASVAAADALLAEIAQGK